MSPSVTRERGNSLFERSKDLLILVLLSLVFCGVAKFCLPSSWCPRLTTALCAHFWDLPPESRLIIIDGEPVIIHGMGDGSIQELTGRDESKVYFAAITARGGEDIQQPRPWSYIDYIFRMN